jgi:hypothetical protein
LPFFQEGFAVAVGGRGGMSSRVVTDIGFYLQKSGLLTYDSILKNDSFYKEDASLTYPVAGLYNMFLLKELGSKRYLELYKKVNGDLGFIKNLSPLGLALPNIKRFDNYLEKYGQQKLISFDPRYFFYRGPLGCGRLGESDSLYIFNVRCSTMNIYPEYDQKWEGINAYKSKLFQEITGQEHAGAVYLLSVDSSYVKVYDCLSNELIFSYDFNFSFEHFLVPVNWVDIYQNPNEYYYFSLYKSIFDKRISDHLSVLVDPQKK